jgi:hypothetical protein
VDAPLRARGTLGIFALGSSGSWRNATHVALGRTPSAAKAVRLVSTNGARKALSWASDEVSQARLREQSPLIGVVRSSLENDRMGDGVPRRWRIMTS